MEELINKVIEWGEPKGLTESRPMLKSWPQYEKVQEEAQEIARALVNNDKDGLIDGIGDTMVTLILLAKQNDLDIQDCLEYAYNEIKGRTGKTVNGKFVKDS
jgi:phosphoribosyl-ATP pyrophosphohydrolase